MSATQPDELAKLVAPAYAAPPHLRGDLMATIRINRRRRLEGRPSIECDAIICVFIDLQRARCRLNRVCECATASNKDDR